MVSFLEIDQFQKWLTYHTEQIGTTDHERLNTVKLADVHPDIPQSAFLQGIPSEFDHVLQNAKLVAFKLYGKYIETGSELEINISGTLRKQLKNILADKEKLMENINVSLNDLLSLFEKPKTEMRMLLNYSHSRFKQKAEYSKIVEVFSKTGSSGLRRVSFSIVNNL